jgi:tetratricopeptide (TPR) repeat protein
MMAMRRQAACLGTLVALAASVPVLCQVPEKPPTNKIPDDWDYVSPGPAKCVEIANVYLHKGKLKAALSRYQEAVQDDPHYAAAYLGLGKVYERMNEKQKALDAYRRYLDELPSAKQAADARDAQRAISRLEKEVDPNAHDPAKIDK